MASFSTDGLSSYSSNAGRSSGISWKNNIPVTPGQSYTVVVGNGGSSPSRSTNGASGVNSGGTSYFINTSTLAASVSSIVGDGGYAGVYTASAGNPLYTDGSYTVIVAPGGSGTPGYKAAGALGQTRSINLSNTSYDGGEGGSAGIVRFYRGSNPGTTTVVSGAGGGTSLYPSSDTTASNTNNLVPSGYPIASINGVNGAGTGLYGAGGYSKIIVINSGTTITAGAGQSGAVRIIWGENRNFPDNAS